MRKSHKRLAALAAGTAAIVAGVGVGYAYWTATGSGSGTAAVGTSADNLVVTGTADSTALTPNGPSSTVSFTAANPASFNQRISKIHLTGVKAYPTAADRTADTNQILTCGSINNGAVANAGTNDFYMGDVTVSSTDGDIVKSATAQALTATGTLVMNDTTSNQDSCKGAFLALSFSTS